MMLRHQTSMIKQQTSKVIKVGKLAWDVGKVRIATKDKTQVDTLTGKLTYDTIKTLGPTFVKIGQFISTRSDIFGKDFTNELKELQDNVVPMTYDEIEPYIQSLQPHFTELQTVPLAAASIGQVHYGVLKSGQEVAIKLKRVGIDETIRMDFTMLLGLINIFKVFMVNRQITEIEISLKEYYSLLQEEINFKNEVANMIKFKQETTGVSFIKVPAPVIELCTNDIIVMEYVPSIKVNDIHALDEMKADKLKISQKLLESYFTQIIDYGFVHIDPHPGNVGITPQGKIVFYDYGMFVSIDGVMRTSLKQLFLAMYDRDVEDVCNILIEMQIVTVEPIKRPSFKKFIASFLAYLDNLNVDDFKVSYLDRIDQEEMQFLISSKMILLLRGITITEGVCKNLNPKFGYREILDPYINTFIIDIEYFERRGTKDISRFTQASNKIIKSEISLDLVENDVNNLKKTLKDKDMKSRYIMMSMCLVLSLQSQPLEAKCITVLAFLYLLVNK